MWISFVLTAPSDARFPDPLPPLPLKRALPFSDKLFSICESPKVVFPLIVLHRESGFRTKPVRSSRPDPPSEYPLFPYLAFWYRRTRPGIPDTSLYNFHFLLRIFILLWVPADSFFLALAPFQLGTLDFFPQSKYPENQRNCPQSLVYFIREHPSLFAAHLFLLPARAILPDQISQSFKYVDTLRFFPQVFCR